MGMAHLLRPVHIFIEERETCASLKNLCAELSGNAHFDCDNLSALKSCIPNVPGF